MSMSWQLLDITSGYPDTSKDDNSPPWATCASAYHPHSEVSTCSEGSACLSVCPSPLVPSLGTMWKTLPFLPVLHHQQTCWECTLLHHSAHRQRHWTVLNPALAPQVTGLQPDLPSLISGPSSSHSFQSTSLPAFQIKDYSPYFCWKFKAFNTAI